MIGKDELLALLETKVPFQHEHHEPVLNMAESEQLQLSLNGARCKNLLLKDKAGAVFLVVTTGTKSLDLAGVAATLGSKRLSFASADTLYDLLGVRPGSLSPLALVNDKTNQVRLVIDAELATEPVFLFHPLENSATVQLARGDLEGFLADIGHVPAWLSLSARAPAEARD